MKNLIIDIGNTQAKLYIIDNQEITSSHIYPDLTTSHLQEIIALHAPQNSIIASTRQFDAALDDFLRATMGLHIWFNPAETPTPIKNCYATPHTLGADRLAAAVGALPYIEKHGKPALLFDFGTAITIDHVSQNGEFLGGNISLGYSMRLVGLHQMTAHLPLLAPPAPEEIRNTDVEKSTTAPPDLEKNKNTHSKPFGTSTNAAIISGVYNSVVFEIEGYFEQNPEKIKIFTGGEAFYFANNSKYAIFADYELVPQGLNRILEYNAH